MLTSLYERERLVSERQRYLRREADHGREIASLRQASVRAGMARAPMAPAARIAPARQGARPA